MQGQIQLVLRKNMNGVAVILRRGAAFPAKYKPEGKCVASGFGCRGERI